MSVGGFLLGAVLMGLGFLMVWKHYRFVQYFGELGDILDIQYSWFNWQTVGIATMVLGFLIAFGIVGIFLQLTVGRIFNLNRVGNV